MCVLSVCLELIVQLVILMTCQSLIAFLGAATLTVLPLFTSAPVASGGLGWDVGDTAIAFALRGGALLLVQLLVFVPLSRRLGWPRFLGACSGARLSALRC